LECIFCKIINGEIPCKKVYEDEKILAFYDLEPQAPIHILIIPKEHISSVLEIDNKNEKIISYIFNKIPEISEKLKINNLKTGFRIVNNCGELGGQSVLHLHFHLLGGRKMAWPPG